VVVNVENLKLNAVENQEADVPENQEDVEEKVVTSHWNNVKMIYAE
tara:strand:- start:443 stop:580 length:138 start_codon:yes stop_codon:yes gene_type:complete